jgi:hypothetical protein
MHKYGLPREINKIRRKDTGISFMSSEKQCRTHNISGDRY